MLCQNCKTNQAEQNSIFGVLPCLDCRNRLSKLQRPKEQVEFTTDNIKEDRKAFSDDILQPYKGDTLSKEYLEKFGTKGIGNPTKEKLDNAEYVWDLDYYKKH
jgi:hypothetical protein